MSKPTAPGTGTSAEVLQYYSKNWEKIANCYALDPDQLPIDVAWYRRRLYNDFLGRRRPGTILDVGCGGGWTVLDALDKGLDARGVEPVPELVEFGRGLLRDRGHDPNRISAGDLAGLSTLDSGSLDCVALLSVLPHVPRERWDSTHQEIARLLRPGGRFVAAYRNALFDLYTFNSFTVEFYHQQLWGCTPCESLRSEQQLAQLRSLMVHPDVPGRYFTAAADKSFGQLDRQKSNPLTMPGYLSQFGLTTERVRFYHYHCVPPLLQEQVRDFRRINHDLELTMPDDWRGHFMAAIFVVEAVRA